MSANEGARQLPDDQQTVWHFSLPQASGAGVMLQGHQSFAHPAFPTPLGQGATSVAGMSISFQQQGQLPYHAVLSGLQFAPPPSLTAAAMAPPPQPLHYSASTLGGSPPARGMGQDAERGPSRDDEGDWTGGRRCSERDEKRRERRSRSRSRDRRNADRRRAERSSSAERVEKYKERRTRSRSRSRSRSSVKGRDGEHGEREHRHKSLSMSSHRGQSRTEEDRSAWSRRDASSSKKRASPERSSSRDDHHRHRSKASSSRSRRGGGSREWEEGSKMIHLRTSQREINVQVYVPPEEAQRLVLEELRDPAILEMKKKTVEEEDDEPTKNKEEKKGGAVRVRYMDDDEEVDDYDAQKEITGDLSFEEIHERLMDLMKRKFIKFIPGDQQCPVSFQAIHNWKFRADDPRLKGGDIEGYQTLKDELLAHTVKNDASLICHGRNEGFHDLNTLFQHCSHVRGSVLHGCVADYLVESGMVDEKLAQRRRASKKAALQGRQGGEQKYVWPPVVYIKGLKKGATVTEKIARGIERVFAYEREREVMASFHASFEGFERARALVEIVQKQRHILGPDAEACIPSLAEFMQLIRSPQRSGKHARFENLKYTEKSSEEISTMLQTELEEKHKKQRQEEREKHARKVKKLEAERGKLWDTLVETKKALEKSEAEELELNWRDTAEKLSQAKQDAALLQKLLAEERAKNLDLHKKYEVDYENKLREALEQQERRQEALRDKEMRDLKIKLGQQEAELRRHQQEQMDRAKTEGELEILRRKHQEELAANKRLLDECERLKQHASQQEKTVTKQLQKKHEEERKRLQEVLDIHKQKNEELSNRVLEGASEDEVKRLEAELEETKETLQGLMDYTIAERTVRTELCDGKKAIVSAILAEEVGVQQKYELDYNIFADMILEIWINQETLYDLLFEEGGKFSKIKSAQQRENKLKSVYADLDSTMRLERGHANPRENFEPYKSKDGVIGEANYDDYHLKRIMNAYGKAVSDYVHKTMVKVDTHNSARYPQYKLWDTQADKDMEMRVGVEKLVQKLIDLAPVLAAQDEGAGKKKRKKGPTTPTTPTTTTAAAPARRVIRQHDSDSESDSSYGMSEDEED